MRSLTALDAALPRLRCPVCSATLSRSDTHVTCPVGHAFDLARQGYLNLAVGRRAMTADSSAMVQARAEFLARGHFRPIADAIVDTVRTSARDPGFVIDLAGGTGYYLSAVLDAVQAWGACLDLAVPALRRAAGVHPRVASVGADAWQRLPLGEATADVLLSVFGPRDPAEVERVLTPEGLFVVVAPDGDHLRELVAPLGLITVDPRKAERSAEAFARFETVSHRAVRASMTLTRGDALLVAAMGPSARHARSEDLAARAAGLPQSSDVTLAVDVSCYRSG